MALFGPFGLFPYGTGPGAPRVPLRPGLLPRSLAQGDYKRDADGLLVVGTYTQQRVLIALTTLLGSMPSAPEIGSIAPGLERDDGRLELTVLRDTERALKPMIDDKSISLDAVEVSVEDGVLTRTITWTDLSTGQQFPTVL